MYLEMVTTAAFTSLLVFVNVTNPKTVAFVWFFFSVRNC